MEYDLSASNGKVNLNVLAGTLRDNLKYLANECYNRLNQVKSSQVDNGDIYTAISGAKELANTALVLHDTLRAYHAIQLQRLTVNL